MAVNTQKQLTPERIKEMSDAEYKVHENRLRRAAARQGLRLEKCRDRDPRSTLYGTYQLVDAYTNFLVSYGSMSGYGLYLNEVEDALNDGPEEATA